MKSTMKKKKMMMMMMYLCSRSACKDSSASSSCFSAIFFRFVSSSTWAGSPWLSSGWWRGWRPEYWRMPTCELRTSTSSCRCRISCFAPSNSTVVLRRLETWAQSRSHHRPDCHFAFGFWDLFLESDILLLQLRVVGEQSRLPEPVFFHLRKFFYSFCGFQLMLFLALQCFLVWLFLHI